LGVTAAVLIGFNQNLLLRMQEGAPTTVALCGILTALLSYGWHEQVLAESTGPWPWAGPTFWALVSGLGLGIALLALGGLALIVIPIVLLHQYYIRAVWIPVPTRMQRRSWWSGWRKNSSLLDGLIAVSVASVVFLPWFAVMFQSHGWRAMRVLEVPTEGLLADHRLSLLPRLIELAPAILPLAVYGSVRTIRSALVDETNSRDTVGGSLWVIWLAVAALAPVVWPNAPQGELELILLVPLCLLAAQTIADLVHRRIPVRSLIWLAPATAVTIAWWASAELHRAVDDLIHGRANAAMALGLHLVVDLVLISVWLLHGLYHWARRRDDRQRLILAAFLLVVISVTMGEGMREVVFRHDATQALLSLRTMVRRRNRDSPFQFVAVVSPNSTMSSQTHPDQLGDRSLPGGRLRFILRTALPTVPQRDLTSTQDLFNLPDGQRLVILTGAQQHLSSADQLRLGVEAIHPGRSGILDVYATAQRRLSRR
jgi:hypothetical protein